jgi:AP endonuclease 2
MVRIVSWNVNGIRTLQPTLKDALDALEADIICLQETKVASGASEQICLVPGYHSFFSFCTLRNGYSGTATFTRIPVMSADAVCVTPVDAGEGLDNAVGGANADWTSCFEKDAGRKGTCDDNSGQSVSLAESNLTQIMREGRVVITDHSHFVCINIYAPAVSVEGRVQFKAAFNRALELKVRSLLKVGRRVLIAGDFNISPAVADVAELVPNVAEFDARPSRAWLRNVVFGDLNLVDSFREMNPRATEAYTCWSEATRARETNFGSRIDLLVVDRLFYDHDVTATAVLREVFGSDHCPVSLDIRDEPFRRNESGLVEPPAFCTKFLKRFSAKQATIVSFMQRSDQAAPLSKAIPLPSSAPEERTFAESFREVHPIPKARTIQKRARTKVERQLPIGAFFQRSASLGASRAQVPERAIECSAPPGHVEQGMGVVERESSHDNCTSTTICGENKNRSDFDGADQWQRLLSGPPPPPLCRGHREPCVLKSVKKAGENKGRTFFSCARPAGKWPTDTAANCCHFTWAPYKSHLMPYAKQ